MIRASLMIDSASRPELLKTTLNSILENLKCNWEEIFWIFHEAVLQKKKSLECLKIFDESGLIDVLIAEPANGQGYSITKSLKRARGDYFIYWVDDHSLIEKLDLNEIFYVMDNNLDINQITLGKRSNGFDLEYWKKEEVEEERNGYKLTVSAHWRYLPSVWRISWIKERWVCFTDHNHHWHINSILQKDAPERKSADWVKKNLGTYYFGPVGEGWYVDNIGKGKGQRNPDYNLEELK